MAGAVVAAMAGATMADVLLPLLAGRLIDAVGVLDAARGDAGVAALWALGGMLALGLGAAVCRHLALLAIISLTLETMGAIARESFWRVQRLSTDWHANSFAGSVVRKITRGMWAVDLLNDTILLALLPSVVVLLGSTVLLGFRWPVMGAIVAGSAIVYLALAALGTLLYVAPAARLSNRWDTRIGGVLADVIGANAVVKAFAAEAREDRALAQVLGQWRRRTRRTWRRGTNNGTAQLLVLLALRTVVIAAALWLWWVGQATPGDVAYVLTMYFVIHGYLRDIGHHISNLQRSVNEMEELVAIDAEPLAVADRPDARPLQVRGGAVAFEQVTFRYGGHARPLYEELSLAIAPGERVGLVGHSGSGKTTFVKLVQRLYDVSGGRILIDGQDIAHATQTSLRAQLAIVQQEPVLFHRSLAENIAYARPGASAAQIAQAARLANAHGFIGRLPDGYATLVGERGVKLSGGERQRVAIARAFLADAPILILDEATSSLDSESEELIQEAMQRLMAGRTSIVIAHRLSTVRALDRILVFDRGRVIEEGSHARLLQRQGGAYRRLFDRQAMGMADAAELALPALRNTARTP
ncbi:ABC transporter ATP-binding protein/permease [Rhodovastum sp. RN2-1]|uniref:ABC transporter ATP-binding protein/permease n=2 Tax=Limobrevibacterium gyesilva TaxID=2991712 RepID=A0AA42CFZ8_9PROT|nr:ABC transporter ATP-binding protein [Limobrevibacterium gyesilva]MCW3475471.1 ABC transporter ATP-binding protein/permease [Limobrevibacterium gyesilva]